MKSEGGTEEGEYKDGDDDEDFERGGGGGSNNGSSGGGGGGGGGGNESRTMTMKTTDGQLELNAIML